MIPILIAGPAIEPVSLTEAKTWLRLETTAEDDLVSALITSARLIVEAVTSRLLITQTWRLVYDAWPKGDGVALPLAPFQFSRAIRVYDAWPKGNCVAIPLAPFQSLPAIRVYDADSVAQTLPPSSLIVDPAPEAARIVFTIEPPQPARLAAGIEIDVIAGYGASSDKVPEPLRHAIRVLVASWFENRGDVETDTANSRLPATAAALISPIAG